MLFPWIAGETLEDTLPSQDLVVFPGESRRMGSQSCQWFTCNLNELQNKIHDPMAFMPATFKFICELCGNTAYQHQGKAQDSVLESPQHWLASDSLLAWQKTSLRLFSVHLKPFSDCFDLLQFGINCISLSFHTISLLATEDRAYLLLCGSCPFPWLDYVRAPEVLALCICVCVWGEREKNMWLNKCFRLYPFERGFHGTYKTSKLEKILYR